MSKKIYAYVIIFGVAIAMFLAGCATTKISSVWKDGTYQTKPRKIMVIGIAAAPASKRTLEDEFVRQIKARGTDAVASYNILPTEQDGNKDAIASKMRDIGADAVLITRIASRETVYTMGGVNYDSPPVYYASWGNYYDAGYYGLTSSADVEAKEYAVMETNIYDINSENRIWSAASDTKIAGSDQQFIKSYVSAMIKSMVRHGVLFNP